MRGVIQVTGRKPWQDRYVCQADPPLGVPLAWIFSRQGSAPTGKMPPQQCGVYKKIVVGQEKWFVHCSFAGALDFVFKALGEGNVNIDEETRKGKLVVPEGMVGSWIGRQGCVAGFLKAMFGLDYIEVIGQADWKKR